MLWGHDGDMHHAWEDDDFTAEAAEQRHKGRSRNQIMADMLNNVLERGDLPNNAPGTV